MKGRGEFRFAKVFGAVLSPKFPINWSANAISYMISRILVLGAGRSSSALILSLLQWGSACQWSVTVGDLSLEAARKLVGAEGSAISFDIADEATSRRALREADLVISMMPATLHIAVARLCLQEGKHLFTASYVSDGMRELDQEARSRGLLFLNECGLDPGIDHMSAMKTIDQIQSGGGRIISFESFTGGLISPDTDPGNPWRYKFTWNPGNVVKAGQGVARFRSGGTLKYIPYQQLFNRLTVVDVPGLGKFEGYPNRDSLKYTDAYGLTGINTMIRGTLRYPGYCAAWNVLVQLGCTDDTYILEDLDSMTHREFVREFIPGNDGELEQQVARYANVHADGPELSKLRWSGFFSNERIGITKGSPAQIVEHILDKKWRLNPSDRDLVVMWHRFVYESGGKAISLETSFSMTGELSGKTAMATTVGMPLALAVKHFAIGTISRVGVVIPTTSDLYDPILSDLVTYGVVFNEVRQTH